MIPIQQFYIDCNEWQPQGILQFVPMANCGAARMSDKKKQLLLKYKTKQSHKYITLIILIYFMNVYMYHNRNIICVWEVIKEDY